MLLALSVGQRDAVDATLTPAVAAGGRADPNPVQDHGFMFSRSIADPDGYVRMDAAAHAATLEIGLERLTTSEIIRARIVPGSWP